MLSSMCLKMSGIASLFIRVCVVVGLWRGCGGGLEGG